MYDNLKEKNNVKFVNILNKLYVITI